MDEQLPSVLPSEHETKEEKHHLVWEKNYVIYAIVVGVVILVLLTSLLVFSKPASKTISQATPSVTPVPTVTLKTEYTNPFDKKSTYQNPFGSSAYKNPFDTTQ